MRALECGTVLKGIKIMVFEVCLGDLEWEVTLEAPIAAGVGGGWSSDGLVCGVCVGGAGGGPDIYGGSGGKWRRQRHETGGPQELGPRGT